MTLSLEYSKFSGLGYRLLRLMACRANGISARYVSCAVLRLPLTRDKAALSTLEQVFNRNPLPSRLEKCELAAKCQLSYKQVRIWVRVQSWDVHLSSWCSMSCYLQFQNRRSRSKKEGKEPKQSPPKDAFLAELQDAIADSMLPPEYGDENDVVFTTVSLVCASFDVALIKSRSLCKTRSSENPPHALFTKHLPMPSLMSIHPLVHMTLFLSLPGNAHSVHLGFEHPGVKANLPGTGLWMWRRSLPCLLGCRSLGRNLKLRRRPFACLSRPPRHVHAHTILRPLGLSGLSGMSFVSRIKPLRLRRTPNLRCPRMAI